MYLLRNVKGIKTTGPVEGYKAPNQPQNSKNSTENAGAKGIKDNVVDNSGKEQVYGPNKDLVTNDGLEKIATNFNITDIEKSDNVNPNNIGESLKNAATKGTNNTNDPVDGQ